MSDNHHQPEPEDSFPIDDSIEFDLEESTEFNLKEIADFDLDDSRELTFNNPSLTEDNGKLADVNQELVLGSAGALHEPTEIDELTGDNTVARDSSAEFRLGSVIEDQETSSSNDIAEQLDGTLAAAGSDSSIIIDVDDPLHGPWAETPASSMNDSFADVADVEFPLDSSHEVATWEPAEHAPVQPEHSPIQNEHPLIQQLAIPVEDAETSSTREAKKRPVVLWTLIIMLLAGSAGWFVVPIMRAHIKYNEGVKLAPNFPDTALLCFQKALNLKPHFPAAECWIAQIHIDKKDWEYASKCLISALESDPECGRAYYLRGIIRLHDKKFDSAIADFNRSMNLDHDIASSAYQRGLAYQQRQGPHDLQHAIDAFTLGIQHDPSIVDASYQRGMLYFQLDRHGEAIRNFDIVLDLQPTHVEATFYRARSWRITGETDKALHDMSIAIKLNPKNRIYKKERATLRTEAGDFPGAIEDWESVTELQEDAEAFIQLGLLQIKTGTPEKAIRSFSSAIVQDPNSSLAYTQRGLLHLESNNIPDARSDLDRSLLLSPNQPLAILASARCEFQAGNPDRAIQRCSQLIQLDRRSVDAHILRGRIYIQRGDLDSAIKDLTTAIDLNKAHAEAYRLRGQVYFKLEKLSKSIEDLTRVIDITPDDLPSLLLRGQIYMSVEMPDKAVEDFREVLQLEPKQLDALRGRAQALFLVEKYQASVADWTSILAITPRDTTALVHRSRCHEKLGKLSEALTDLESAFALDPTLEEKHKVELADLYLQRGSQSLEDGDWQDALADFNTAITADEDVRRTAEDAMAIVYRQRASQLLDDEGPEEALVDLDSCLKLRPEDQEALRLRGDIHVQLGNHQQAIDDYSALLSLKPGDEHSLFARGRSRHALKRYKEAVADFTDVLLISSIHDIAYIERARAQAALNLFDEAINDFSEAILIEPSNLGIVSPELANILRLRGEHYFADSAFAAAIADFKRALAMDGSLSSLLNSSFSQSHYSLGSQGMKEKHLDDAIDHFNQALEIDSTMVLALVGRGECHLQMSVLDTAHDDFTAAIVMEPVDSIIRARALLGRAEVAVARDTPDQAIVDLNIALKLDPQPADSMLLARCYIARGQILVTRENRTLGDLEDGIEDFETAIGLDKTREGTHRAVIIQAFIDLAHKEIEQFDEKPGMPIVNSAISHLRHVLNVDPVAADLIAAPLAGAYHRRGKLFHTAGNFTSAIDDFQEAMISDPRVKEMVAADIALAFFQRGMLKKGETAIADFTEALGFNSALDIAYVQRGQVHLELTSFSAAIDDFGRAIEIHQENLEILKDDYARAYRLRAEKHFIDNQFAHAVADFEKAIDLDDSLAPLVKGSLSQSHCELGTESMESKQLDHAVEHFNQALSIDAGMVSALVSRGRCHRHMNKLNAAHADFTAAIAMMPGDSILHAGALLGRAEVAISQNDPDHDMAISDLNTALDLRPQPADKQLLAQCHLNRGKALVARKNRTIDNLEDGISDFKAAIDLDPAQEDTLRIARSGALHDLGRMEIAQFDEKPEEKFITSAIHHLRQVVQVDPQASSLVEKSLSGAYHRRGRLYHGINEYSKAISEFDLALETDITILDLLAADMALAYAQRGLAHARLKTASARVDGIADFRKALEFDVNVRPIVQGPLAASLANQAYTQLKKGSTAEAISLLEAASEAHPDFTENRSLAELLRHQAIVTAEQEVIRDLRERLTNTHNIQAPQIKMQPVPKQIRDQLGKQFGRARQLYKIGMLEQALAAMNGIIQQGWAMPFHYYYRGIILFELDEPKERWTIDFETGSYLEACGLQNPEEIGGLLIDVQGESRSLLQSQRNLGPSILVNRKQDRQKDRDLQLAAAMIETERYEAKS
jgi:tetratricopeptide (TPR) repeat protein